MLTLTAVECFLSKLLFSFRAFEFQIGLELLEVGGRLVYSTCSMSPVEDEAVVQRMLLDAGIDNVVLEDATSLVPGLKFTPGISSWKVSTKAGELFSTWADVDEKSKSQIRPYMVGCIKIRFKI